MNCGECGEEFESRIGEYWCSNKCYRMLWQSEQKAKKYGVRFEPVGLGYLIKRDKATCQICGKLVSSETEASSPSIDHIIPISRGGSHTDHNLQLACKQCNHEKDNKIISSMLIGR